MKNIRIWLRAARPWSFTVSIVPPVLGSIIALNENPGLSLNWSHFLLTLTGCVAAHASANVFSDYFDYKNGIDKPGNYGSSSVMVDKLLTPEQLLIIPAAGFSVAAAAGIYLMTTIPNGTSLAWLVCTGAFLGFFYTTPPFAIKYRALGDIAVFLAFGPLMTLGAYFVQAGAYSWKPFLYAIPAALLVSAILHGNNLRDIKADSTTGIKTVAMMLKDSGAKKMYYLLLSGAYAATVLLTVFAGLTWISLITFISLPMAVKLIKIVKNKEAVGAESFAAIDAMTARLHSAFSLLFIIALLMCLLSKSFADT
ncbi:MAG: 1,4-dihydroxy-2-naphthoate octaprenyltransferase [Elusimicrobia bacterium GWC2_51_8]|nr:MAG: 1,4-dihydroxy-2-naphthoate octaprenyltransferase [Elusimicrobia bacterium GWA2_51_34]OGR65213.1 MAG: 1,4-dihydroxy-2-naphthoate octaprenyltransferase [Elusimicrobia bacterium GWC2_51_8]OGR84530.1 MAG: 1,4-dihydroxy-2-naphthoate octaprenyltransferase [Elusimicrobia bacterium GWF2_52_66]HCE98326.1 1,4-dihydroxy-2-naphthoate octaprenyltransferase [Elusimicrobiota bacterium]